MEFDLKITIPKGRKPGKYLQKIQNDIPDLSALVKSLDFCPKEFKTQDEYSKALYHCHSCQSYSDSQALFYEVYSKLPDIRFIGLVGDRQTPVARCLVNTKTGTFAPVYGPLHFMLEQRLLFAGYEKGSIVTETMEKEIQEMVNIETFPVTSPNKYPKSKIKTKFLVYEYPEKPEYYTRIQESLLKEAKDNLEYFLSEVPESCVIKAQVLFETWPITRRYSNDYNKLVKAERENAVDYNVLNGVNYWTKSLIENQKAWQRYYNEKRKYKRAFKKNYTKLHNLGKPLDIKFGDTFEIEIKYWAPIKEDYYLVEKNQTFEIQTTLFLDATKSYVNGTQITYAGWYSKF